MQEFDDLLLKCGFVKQNNAACDFQIIEQFLGFSLPTDYKYYLNNYELFEDFIDEQYISLYDFNTVKELHADIGDVEKQSSSILIGSNGASESIGLQFLGDSNYRVVIAQYMYDVDDYVEVGVSFTDMIQRLHDGIEWFKA